MGNEIVYGWIPYSLFSLPFIAKESFLCDFSHNIVTEKHNFLFACDMMVGKEETREIISDGKRKACVIPCRV